MPDFDPTTIPTLDDVIETIESDDIEKNNDSVETEPTAVDDEPALFIAEPIVDFAANIDDESIEAESNIDESIELPSTDSDIDSGLNSAINSETEIIESALIDYNAEHDADSSIEGNTTETDGIAYKIACESACEIDELPEPTTEPQPLITPIELQAITDDVVNQLMPELEQRLRVLIQQTLKEKLPPAVISPEPTTSTNSED